MTEKGGAMKAKGGTGDLKASQSPKAPFGNAPPLSPVSPKTLNVHKKGHRLREKEAQLAECLKDEGCSLVAMAQHLKPLSTQNLGPKSAP